MANKSDMPAKPNPRGYSSLDRAAKVADENAMKVVARGGRFFVVQEEFDPEAYFDSARKVRQMMDKKMINIHKRQMKKELKPKQNKGGLPKKPKFMKGGSYKGKSHMYAAGGMVKELKI